MERENLAVYLSTSSSPPLASSDWIYDKPFSWFHRLCFYVLKWGRVPKHVAIVMDGNRRYARKTQVEKIEGHQKG